MVTAAVPPFAIAILPSAPGATMTKLAAFSLTRYSTCGVPGLAVPDGKMVARPSPVPYASTVAAMAVTPVAGTPPKPTTVDVAVAPAATSVPSTIRDGLSGTYTEPPGPVPARTYPCTSTLTDTGAGPLLVTAIRPDAASAPVAAVRAVRPARYVTLVVAGTAVPAACTVSVPCAVPVTVRLTATAVAPAGTPTRPAT